MSLTLGLYIAHRFLGIAVGAFVAVFLPRLGQRASARYADDADSHLLHRILTSTG